MNTINEMCLAWYMWVNGNYDILIMTITLIVVAGLVLEVVRLNRIFLNTRDSMASDINRLEKSNIEHFGYKEYNELFYKLLIPALILLALEIICLKVSVVFRPISSLSPAKSTGRTTFSPNIIF